MIRENNFGIIRLLGAVMVIIGHMYTLVGQVTPSILWNTVSSLGVAIFFVIGGYLITLSWMREPQFKRYIIKRIFRIFPALITCILITVFIIGPLLTDLTVKEYFSNLLTWDYLKNIALNIRYALPGVFMGNPYAGVVNGSIWCLPVEFLLYLVIPIYISIGLKLPERVGKVYYWTIASVVCLMGAIWTTWFYDTHYVFYGMDLSQVMMIVPYYFVGSLFAVCKLEKCLNPQIALVAIIVAAGFNFLQPPFVYIAAYLVIPYVILSLALSEKPVFVKVNRIDISYGMFLFSFVIQQILVQVWMYADWTLNVYVLMIVSILLSAFVGIIMEWRVEKPMGRLCKSILKRV